MKCFSVPYIINSQKPTNSIVIRNIEQSPIDFQLRGMTKKAYRYQQSLAKMSHGVATTTPHNVIRHGE